MNRSQPAGESVALIFDWAARLDRRRRLVVWLVVALLIHIGALFLLGHQAPKVIPRLPDEATLFVLSNQEFSALEAFVNTADPALFAPGQVRDGLLENANHPRYRPTFDTMEFKPLPLPREVVRILPRVDARLMDAVKSAGAQSMTAGEIAPSAPTRTQVRISDELTSRATSMNWGRTTAVIPDGDFLPSEFLVAVDGEGMVRHVFPRSSTRNNSQSSAVMQDLFDGQFEKSHASPQLTWGTVTVHWGQPEDIQP